MVELRSFHGKQEVKDKYLARVRSHALADEIVKGVYWERGKGCAVGCTIHSDEHDAYEKELGLPEWLARLEDTLFEGMSNEQAKSFPVRFLEAIPVGSDLSKVETFFKLYLVEENLLRVQLLEDISDSLRDELVSALLGVKDYLLGVLAGTATEKQRESAARSAAESAERSAARSAARSAVWSAERSAARSAVWSAVWSAARSAVWSAESAAESAVWSAESAVWSAESAAESAVWSAESAARSAAYDAMAEKLLELLKEPPTKENKV